MIWLYFLKIAMYIVSCHNFTDITRHIINLLCTYNIHDWLLDDNYGLNLTFPSFILESVIATKSYIEVWEKNW